MHHEKHFSRRSAPTILLLYYFRRSKFLIFKLYFIRLYHCHKSIMRKRNCCSFHNSSQTTEWISLNVYSISVKSERSFSFRFKCLPLGTGIFKLFCKDACLNYQFRHVIPDKKKSKSGILGALQAPSFSAGKQYVP